MDKIPFEDGVKLKNATVIVGGQEYEVNPAQYSGKTPLSPFNLNKMQDNIENTINEMQNNTEKALKEILYKGYSEDLNLITKTGNYAFNNTTLNTPSPNSYGNVLMFIGNGTEITDGIWWAFQVAFTTSNNMFFRHYVDGTWQGWIQVK